MKHLFYLLLTLPLFAAEPPQPPRKEIVSFVAINTPVCDHCDKCVTYIVHDQGKIVKLCADHWLYGKKILDKRSKQ